MRNYVEEIKELTSEINNLNLVKSEKERQIRDSLTRTEKEHKERKLADSERSGWSSN